MQTKIFWILFIFATFLRIDYAGKNPRPNISHEALNFVEMIKIIKTENKVPEWNKCWACYHPPLYFWSIAQLSNFTDKVQIIDIHLFAQTISLILSLIFLYLLALFLNLTLRIDTCVDEPLDMMRERKTDVLKFNFAIHVRDYLKNFSQSENLPFYLSFSLIAFWPAVIMHTVRIGNESLNYVLFIWFFYALLKYHIQPKRHYWLSFVVIIVLAILTKNSFFILIGILFGFLLNKKIRLAYMLGLGVFVLVTETLLQTFKYSMVPKGLAQQLIRNLSGLPDWLRIKISLWNIWGFNISHYFKIYILTPMGNSDIQSSFTPVFLRTAAIGEFDYVEFGNGPRWLYLGITSVWLLFVFSVVVLWIKNYRRENFLIPTLASVVSYFALTALVLMTGFACSEDARYILPGLVMLFVIFGLIFKINFQRPWVSRLLYSQAILLILLSIGFILTLKPGQRLF